jgi:hypothetical protein
MNQSDIRVSLHHWIDSLADEDLPLVNAIMEAESGHATRLSPVQFKELNERRARFLRGEGKNYTPAEAMAMVREKDLGLNESL